MTQQIAEEVEHPTEISYQLVNQAGVTPKIWESARNTAMKMGHSTARDINRVKFRHAPYALVVYVYDRKHKAEARKQLMDKYGTLESAEWPTMRDGSKLKFIPSIKKPTKETILYLTKYLWIQANSKANEITYELKAWNLTEKKEYLGGASMEYIIHTRMSSERKGIPLFKHIGKKWTDNPSEEKYEVIIQPNMQNEAREYMRTIKNKLATEYGQKVLSHFNEWEHQKNSVESWENLNDSEDEMNTLISTFMNNGDNYGNILVEGTETIQKDYQERETKSNEPRRRDTSSSESMQTSVVTGMSGMTSVMGSINSAKGKVDWEKGTKDNEMTTEKKEKKQEKAFRKTMKQCGIKMKEIKNWVEENPDEYKELYTKSGNKEYQAMKLVIKAIVAIRLSEEDDEVSLAEIRNFSQKHTKEVDENNSDNESRKNLPTEETISSNQKGASHPIEEKSSTQEEEKNREGGQRA